MNVEKIIYNLVKKIPFLKFLLKNFYQFLYSFNKFPKFSSEKPFFIIKNAFFGFHDKTPFSPGDKFVLVHKYNKPLNYGKKTIEIGFLDLEKNFEYRKISSTIAWNWQQGSMLQWLKNSIIFNFLDGDKNIKSKVVNLDGNLIELLNFPIAAVSKDFTYGISYDFNRFKIGMKGYEYPQSKNTSNFKENEPNDSYLTLYNFESKVFTRLFAVKEIANLNRLESMNNAYHFFTHCVFNPTGNRIVFLHRWKKKGLRLYSRLVSCDLNGENIHIFSTNEMVSHFSWINEKKIIAYCSIKNQKDGYYILEDFNNEVKNLSHIFPKVDGHPQQNPVNNLIVTDTYPNKYRIQNLFIIDIEKNELVEVAKLYSPFIFQEKNRCDLHPRWSRNGKMISVDSGFNGKRNLIIFKDIK